MPINGVDSLELKGRVRTMQNMDNDKVWGIRSRFIFCVFDVSNGALVIFLQDITDMLVWLKRNVVATESLLRVCAHQSPSSPISLTHH